MRSTRLLGPLLLLVACGACAGTAKLESHRPEGPIVIDGDASDWQGKLRAVEDAKLTVGVGNDDEYLYLTLVSANREVQQQIVRSGLIVWLDAKGDKKKELGIQYPIGRMNDGSGLPPREEMMRWRMADETAREMMIAAELKSAPATIELRRAADEAGRRVDLETLEGLEVAVAYEARKLIYELRIPLNGDNPATLALDSKPGDKITIGIEVPKPDLSSMRRPSGGGKGGGRGGGGRGGGMGGGGMGGGGHGGGTRGAMAETIDTWIEVELTKAN